MTKSLKIILVVMGIAILANLVISIVGLVGVNQLSQFIGKLGGTTNYDNVTVSGTFTGATLSISGESTIGDTTLKKVSGTIAAGSWYTCEQVNTTATTTVTDAYMGYSDIAGVNASSSYKMTMVATSSAGTTILSHYTQKALGFNSDFQNGFSIMPATTYATSTTATTTSLATINHSYPVNVPPSWYVCTVLQPVDAGSSWGKFTESATSSARGVLPFYRFNVERQ